MRLILLDMAKAVSYAVACPFNRQKGIIIFAKHSSRLGKHFIMLES